MGSWMGSKHSAAGAMAASPNRVLQHAEAELWQRRPAYADARDHFDPSHRAFFVRDDDAERPFFFIKVDSATVVREQDRFLRGGRIDFGNRQHDPIAVLGLDEHVTGHAFSA